MPKVSIIIPAYNAMTYLPETVESVLRQTFTDFEVLIVDDGSSDQIVQWVSELEDPRVKLISQENQGVSLARNTGIAYAQGEYVAFLDADDLWTPTKLEKQVICLDQNPSVGLVHTWMALIDCKGKSNGRVMTSNAEGNTWQQLLEKNMVACSSVMVRRCCLQNVGGFEPHLNFAEDWDMWIRISAHYHFAVIKEALYYYRQVPNSLSKNIRVLEQAFLFVIEKAFHSVPPKLLYLKKHSYGYANLCLAWKALQSSCRDYKLARYYRQKAISYYPHLRYSHENIRLSVAIIALQLFGNDSYSKLLELAYALRRQILSFPNLDSINSFKIIDKTTQ
ncbi:glycosyltransferase family A protein [Chlorogloeopsis sp. ULAP01]|uniref:glycosyltransferase family 2 protein n=1 Tax=Chlorogloeopsis sp. ULAP01 TaxID=3056483 RepID=UPI0025AA4383|nr:glycosyltransferase family A protein [Chlorogloeopsis sp. ULAP01]MDM9381603.1 glycosyltransferase family A protein [Chlorogloeopsis sp. ULAP01]